MRSFLFAGDGEGGDADFEAFDLGEGGAAAGEGGTGGEDVVDEEDMAPFKLFGMADGEGILDVEEAVVGGLEALLMGVTVAADGTAVDGSREGLCDAAAEELALVVAALESAAPVERHGDEEVDFVETTRMQQVQAHATTHKEAEVAVAVELHGVDEALDGVALLKEEERRGMLDRDESGEELLGGISVVRAVERGAEVGETVETDLFLTLHQHFAAAGAGGGEKNLEEAGFEN
jgi:hypothetical protein